MKQPTSGLVVFPKVLPSHSTTTTPTLHSQLLRGEPLGDLSLFLRNTPLVATFVLQTQVQGSLVASLRPHSLVLEPDFLTCSQERWSCTELGPWSLLLIRQVGAVRDPADCPLLPKKGLPNVQPPHPPAPLLVRPQPPVPFERRKGLEFPRQIKFHVPP